MTAKTIYANYAATSPSLSAAAAACLHDYISGTHLNAGRNFEGLEAGAAALRARKAVGALLGINDPLRVIFASGATAALNMAINGLVRPGDHVLASGVEHNASARPLESLRKNGVIELDWLPCGKDGSLDAGKIRPALRKNTRLLVMTHASNVLGTILPAPECFAIVREYGVFTVLDMAQTAGILPFDFADLCDVMVFAGHKGLGALAGIGGCTLSGRAAEELRPWVQGGTGSASHSLDMPEFLPDRFEPGTQNTIGMVSLGASVEEVLYTGVETIRRREQALTARFLSGLRDIKKIHVRGTGDPDRCVPVVSVVIEGQDSGEVARRLFEDYGIITRSGLQCSPLAHKCAGTFPDGTVRFSFGRETTEAEIDAILAAMAEL
jgi:cysteine desulfurase family protein